MCVYMFEHVFVMYMRLVFFIPQTRFFKLIPEMGSVTPSSEKWVTLPLMPTKMGSLQRQQNYFLIITKHTLHVCNSEQLR